MFVHSSALIKVIKSASRIGEYKCRIKNNIANFKREFVTGTIFFLKLITVDYIYCLNLN